jgi:AAA domain
MMLSCPQWIQDAAGTSEQKAENAGQVLVDETPEAVAKAREYLEKWSPDAEPGNLKTRSFRVAVRLLEIGVSESTALVLLGEWNDRRAGSAVSLEQLQIQVRDATLYMRKPRGILSPDNASGFTAVEDEPEERTEESDDEASAKSFPFTLAKDITLAPKKFIIDDLVGVGEVSSWYGEPDSGKSTAILHAGCCTASGLLFCGKRILTPGPVLYVAAERGAVVKRRILAWCKHHEVTDLPLAVVDNAVNLRTSMVDTCRIIATANTLAETCGASVVWIIFDTLNRVLAGGDENSPADMGNLIAAVDRVNRETGAHCSTVHHTPLGKLRLRGHSSLLGALDLTVQVAKGDWGGVEIRADKANDLVEKPKFNFNFKSIPLFTDPETGVRTTAPVLVPMEAPDPFEGRLTPEQEAVFDSIKKLVADNPGRAFSASEAFQNPTEWAALGDAEKSAFRRVLNELNETQRILKVSAKGKKTLYKLADPTNPTKPNESPCPS